MSMLEEKTDKKEDTNPSLFTAAFQSCKQEADDGLHKLAKMAVV